ncbi:MAG: B12-binding domain-containing radical SAM protein [Desulfomonilaceae bacterium]
MACRVLLTTAPTSFENRYGRFAVAGSTQPSFGLVCLAAVALREGHEVKVIDAAAENLSVDETVQEALRFSPDIIGISATTAGIVPAAELAALAKKSLADTLTVVGGPHVTALPAETLEESPAIDIGVVGEGEETLAELLSVVGRKNAVTQRILGTVIRHNGRITVHPRRPLIADLDQLPLPAWSLLRGFPRRFRPSLVRLNRLPCCSVVLTRGCPNRCLFCDRSVFGNKCRSYSPTYAINMIEDLRYNYGVKEILIEDDTFVVDRKRVEEFCQRIIDGKIDITWSCLGRADRMTPELLHLMKRAGCWNIAYGIECGDETILKAMSKKLTIEQIEQAVSWSKKAGLTTRGFFMVGFPGETHESMAATLDLATRLPLDDISVMQLTPFPGTDLYQRAEEFGTLYKDWKKMNSLNTVFVPFGFTEEDLEKARNRMIKEFYLRPRIVFSKLLQIVTTPRLLFALPRGILDLVKWLFPAKRDVGTAATLNTSSGKPKIGG